MTRRPTRFLLVLLIAAWSGMAAAAERPNIVWITCEDISADLGCYGDTYSRTPTLDRLAAEGVRYSNCFTHVGVCAPSRSGIITGMYPCSIGSQHMRSQTVLPEYIRCFPAYLRDAGYYCTNNSKTDYNFTAPKDSWDASNGNAHWRDRPEGKPFFAVFNITVTHESQIRAPQAAFERNTAKLTPDQRHDPAQAPVPPYLPDTPVVRHDIAQYYDNITAMDYIVAQRLQELDDAGLADDTIVFFYSDHGAGMPRAKRWLYDSSLHVPLIVRWPEKWRSKDTKSDGLTPGSVRDELVAFVDLAPTVLSIAGVEIPKHMQGQAFLGAAQADKPREFIYGARDRMDERVDMLRAVRDKQFKYIRNYQWWKPYAQNINYMNEMPTMQEWRRLAAEGKLAGPQRHFMAPQKPREELYDCVADPHETNNLADDPHYAEQLARLRAAHDKWTTDIRDLGYLPEYSLQEFMTLGPDWRDRPKVFATSLACREMQLAWEAAPGLDAGIAALTKPWQEPLSGGVDATALKIRSLQLAANDPAAASLANDGLADQSLAVQAAAFAAYYGVTTDPNLPSPPNADAQARDVALKALASNNPYVRHMIVLALDDLGDDAKGYLDEIRAMIAADRAYAARVGEFIVASRTGERIKGDGDEAAPKKDRRKKAKKEAKAE